MHGGNGVASLAARGSRNAEARKAAQCPVPGAVVIAPLTQSVRNYGSLGGSFTVVGAPVLGANGATFDGSTNMLTIAATLNQYTLIWLGKMTNTAAASYHTMLGVGSYATNAMLTKVSTSLNFVLTHLSPAAPIDSGVPLDTTFHIFTIKSEAALTSLYIDGVLRGTAAYTGNGTSINLGAANTTPVYKCGCTDKNVIAFADVLSAPNQAAVEAYVAAA